MSADQELQRIIDLVHRRDDLLRQRADLTADLDRQIAAIDAQIVSRRTAIGSSVSGVIGAAAVGFLLGTAMPKVKPGTHAEKVLRLKAQNPSIGRDELLKAVYGEDTPRARHALTAVIGNLKKTGRWIAGGETEVEAA